MTKTKRCPPCNNDCDQSDTCPARKCQHCNGTGRDASGYPCTCVPKKSDSSSRRKFRATFSDDQPTKFKYFFWFLVGFNAVIFFVGMCLLAVK
jgi:hypothetical protein